MCKTIKLVENNARLRKEFKLIPTSKNFKVTFGTTNRISPSVIYIKLNTWIKYTGEIKDYNDNINILNSDIRIAIKNEIRNINYFTDMFFYTPEIKKIITKKTNSSHACFEITLKQKEPLIYNIKSLNNCLFELTDKLICIIENNPNFQFNIKK